MRSSTAIYGIITIGSIGILQMDHEKVESRTKTIQGIVIAQPVYKKSLLFSDEAIIRIQTKDGLTKIIIEGEDAERAAAHISPPDSIEYALGIFDTAKQPDYRTRHLDDRIRINGARLPP